MHPLPQSPWVPLAAVLGCASDELANIHSLPDTSCPRHPYSLRFARAPKRCRTLHSHALPQASCASGHCLPHGCFMLSTAMVWLTLLPYPQLCPKELPKHAQRTAGPPDPFRGTVQQHTHALPAANPLHRRHTETSAEPHGTAQACRDVHCRALLSPVPPACNCGVTALFPWIRLFLALPQSRNTHLLSAYTPSRTCCPSDTPTLLLVHMSWGTGHVQPKYPLQRRLSGGTIETRRSIYTNACRFPCSNYFTEQRMIQ